MKKLLTCFLVVVSCSCFSQSFETLEESKTKIINDIECTYRINQESSKKSGETEYSRYVLDFYIVNKSSCNIYINYRSGYGFDNSTNNLMATFSVRNANGKRFTSKEGKIYAKPWWVRVKSNEKDEKGKDVVRLRDMQAGFVFQKGEQLKTQIIVLVPLGEKPEVELSLAYISENG